MGALSPMHLILVLVVCLDHLRTGKLPELGRPSVAGSESSERQPTGSMATFDATRAEVVLRNLVGATGFEPATS